eukprot:4903002-Amphidinium_carterae.1
MAKTVYLISICVVLELWGGGTIFGPSRDRTACRIWLSQARCLLRRFFRSPALCPFDRTHGRKMGALAHSESGRG